MYTSASIAELAEQVRVYLGNQDEIFKSAPYLPKDNLGRAVEILGGTLIVVDEHGWDYAWGTGVIRGLDDGPPHFEIKIPTYTSPLRDVFTVAHEIGHLFVHLGYNTDQWKTDEFRDTIMYRADRNANENEANLFAASMLMPEPEFRNLSTQHQTHEDKANLAEVAAHFGVSESAAETRSKFLGIIPW